MLMSSSEEATLVSVFQKLYCWKNASQKLLNIDISIYQYDPTELHN